MIWKAFILMRRRNTSGEQHTTQSVSRAAHLLKVFLAAHTSFGVTELSRVSGLPISTVHRLLTTLVDAGLLIYHQDAGRYSLSALLAGSSPGATSVEQLRRHCLPFVEQLAVELGEDVGVAVLQPPYVLFLYVLEKHRQPHVNVRPGSITPAHSTASGKLLLAFLSKDVRDHVLREHPLPMYTRSTITSPSLLARELERIRERGVAMEDEEFIPGVRSIAVPVTGKDGQALGALMVIGPKERLTDVKLILCQARLKATAEAITKRLCGSAVPAHEFFAHEVQLDLGSEVFLRG